MSRADIHFLVERPEMDGTYFIFLKTDMKEGVKEDIWNKKLYKEEDENLREFKSLRI